MEYFLAFFKGFGLDDIFHRDQHRHKADE